MERQLTLHHATLVLNFATLSTVASMAATPTIPIWRVLRRGQHKKKGEFQKELEERAKGRIILSLALGAQIIFQWTWVILMFVDPFYNQLPCSPDTRIVYLAGVQTAQQINDNIVPWALWLLLCFSSSLVFGVAMVYSCTSEIHEASLKYSHIKAAFPNMERAI